MVFADDHDLVRGGIALLPDVEVMAEASTGEESLAFLASVAPDLVIAATGRD